MLNESVSSVSWQSDEVVGVSDSVLREKLLKGGEIQDFSKRRLKQDVLFQEEANRARKGTAG